MIPRNARNLWLEFSRQEAEGKGPTLSKQSLINSEAECPGKRKILSRIWLFREF